MKLFCVMLASLRRLYISPSSCHPFHPPAPQNSSTALHIAADNGKTDAVRALLAAGASANARNEVRLRRLEPCR